MPICLSRRLMEAAFCVFHCGVCRGWAMFCRLMNAAQCMQILVSLVWGDTMRVQGFNAKCPQWKTSNETAQRQTEQQAPSALSDWPHTNSGRFCSHVHQWSCVRETRGKWLTSVSECPPVVKKVNVLSQQSATRGLHGELHPTCVLVYCIVVNLPDHSPACILPSDTYSAFDSATQATPPHLRDAEVLMQRLLAVVVVGAGPFHCLLLSRIALQLSDQDWSRLWGGLVEMCLLWQAVNRMCSHAGLASTPDWETQWAAGIT